jgi:hypothetical protein
VAITVDLGRTATAKERVRLEGRLRRLDHPEHVKHVESISEVMPGRLDPGGLTFRVGFSYTGVPIDADPSDRKAPPHELRPPATRLMNGRGAALRLAISLLAVAQANRKAGAKARLSALGVEVAGSSDRLGWTDMVVTDAVDTHGKNVFLTSRDKRARSVRNAFRALESAGLISVPDESLGRNRYEKFVLLDERGTNSVREAAEYRVPKPNEPTFALPGGFFTNGWVHVLEDSEIALLLMVACGRGGWPAGNMLAIPAETRLLHYGLHRDPFSSARKTLDWFGLLDVEEVGRHDDGRAEEANLRVHRLALIGAGFDEPAPQRVIQELKVQIARS